jgi:mRNA-degrading endonuclease HigB of HigAB toxin-antitoxin module
MRLQSVLHASYFFLNWLWHSTICEKTVISVHSLITVCNQRNCFSKYYFDIKNAPLIFAPIDSVGNQRYVFNIKGNRYRLVVAIKFAIQFVYIRFVGTHAEYDKIDCSIIKKQIHNYDKD